VITHRTYTAAANKLRRYADRIEQLAAARTPSDRRALTLAIHGAARATKELSEKHRGANAKPSL
jgi:hypothetical protein